MTSRFLQKKRSFGDGGQRLATRVALISIFSSVLLVPVLANTSAQAVTFSPWKKHVTNVVLNADRATLIQPGGGSIRRSIEYSNALLLVSSPGVTQPRVGYDVILPPASRYDRVVLAAEFALGSSRFYPPLTGYLRGSFAQSRIGTTVSGGYSMKVVGIVAGDVKTDIQGRLVVVYLQSRASCSPSCDQNIVALKKVIVQVTYWTGYPLPGSTTIGSLVGGNGSLRLSWNTASPCPKGYCGLLGNKTLGFQQQIRSFNAARRSWGAWTTTSTGATSGSKVWGVTNGRVYQARVRAYTRGGYGAWSALRSIRAGLPGAPSSFMAEGGNRLVDLSWAAAQGNGSAVRSYQVLSRAQVNGAWTPWGVRNFGSSVRSVRLGSLINGRKYQFTVKAINRWGSSTGAAISAATPGTIPDSPNNVMVDPGNGLVRVSWTAPVWNGGSAVTSYAISDGQGGNCGTPTGSTYTCTVEGLTNGNTYAISVIAINRFGSSNPSPVVEASPHPVAPDAPANPTVAPKDGQVEVSWLPPSTDGGSPVTGYVATASPGGAICSTTGELSCIVSRLANGTSYTFTVVAVNDYGASVASGPSSPTTPATNPTPPTVSSVTTTLNSATATWAAPSADGGSPVIEYTATLSPGGQTCTTSSQSCTITSIQDNHAEYQVTVVARNAASVSNSSSPFTFHLRGATQVSAGSRSTCALLNSGDAACWGFGATGALGNGTDGGTNNSYQSAVPLRVVGLPASLKQVSVGDGSACALDSVGAVWCWGSRIGSPLSHILTPTKVVGIPDAVSEISAGVGFECALTVNGAVYCWGGNSRGQLGNGTLTNSTSPVPVYGLTNGVTHIASGKFSACAVLIGGAVKCWGDNAYGGLGNGSLIDSSIPVGVTGLPGPVRQISVGTFISCAVLLSNDSYCWGYGSHGQLGDGGSTSSPVPVRVALPDATVRSITVGGFDFACAISTVNLGSCWGVASTGQLGRPFALDQSIPQILLSSDFPDGLESISASESRWACGILTSGAIKCWGNNLDGSLGNGSTVDSVGGAGGVSPAGVIGIS